MDVALPLAWGSAGRDAKDLKEVCSAISGPSCSVHILPPGPTERGNALGFSADSIRIGDGMQTLAMRLIRV